MLEARGASIHYGPARTPDTVRGADLSIELGETVGLVGESGSGKSSLVKALVGLVPLSGGEILLDGKVVASSGRRMRPSARRGIQLVFQDPRASLNPRMSVEQTLREAVELGGYSGSKARARVAELLDLIQLSQTHLSRYPHQMSGGQLQRVAVARALAVDPRYLLLDEVTASLDVSVQARVLNLLRRLQSELGFSMLYISHDLSIIRYMSDRVYVMKSGELIESGPTEELYGDPKNDYTKRLLRAVPVFGGDHLRPLESAGSNPDAV